MKTWIFTVALICLFVVVSTQVTLDATLCNQNVIANANWQNLTTPNYPNLSYNPNGTICTWKIDASGDNTSVLLDVHDLLFPNFIQCESQSLTVYDGEDTDAKVVLLLCGRPLRRHAILSTGSSLTVVFRYFMTQVIQRGVWLKYTEISSTECFQKISVTREWGVVKSPGYPIIINRNGTCTWILEAENENDTITLEAMVVDLVDDFQCSSTKVMVFNDNTTDEYQHLGYFCGTDRHPSFRSGGNVMRIDFRTFLPGTIYNQHRGFEMRVRSTPASDCNATYQVYPQRQQYFVSPGYPNEYYPDLWCQWQLYTPNSQSALKFVVETSDIDDTPPCFHDYVSVYKDFNISVPSYTTFCGEQTPVVAPNTKFATVIFKSGNNNNKATGFRIKYEVVDRIVSCGPSNLTVTTQPQILTSPDYPNIYIRNTDCTYVLTAPSGMWVRIVVLDSDMDSSRGCTGDHVAVYDGTITDQAHLLQTWCGVMKPSVQSRESTMTLQFHSDYMIHYYRGFKLQYFGTTDPLVCGTSLPGSHSLQTLQSPGYPLNRQSYIECFWTITSIYSVENIQLQFIDMSVKYSPTCQMDYVEILDGSTTQANTIGRMCGVDEQTIVSSGSDISVRYRTYISDQVQYFSLYYSSGQYKVCGDLELYGISTNKHISSPYYPFNYPNNNECDWRIDSLTDNFVIILNGMDSNIEWSKNCVYDYLEAFDGYDDISDSLGRWCGGQLPSNIQSTGRYMYIKFVTDGSNTQRGFKLAYNSIYVDPYYTGGSAIPIVGGIFGGIVFLTLICIIVTIAAKRASRATVTRVTNTSGSPGDIYTVNQGRFETTLTASGSISGGAMFQPPPAYSQVSKINGHSQPPPPPYAQLPTNQSTSRQAPLLSAPSSVLPALSGAQQTPTGAQQTPTGAQQTPNGSMQAPITSNQPPNGAQTTPNGTGSAMIGDRSTTVNSGPIVTTVSEESISVISNFPNQGVTSDTAPIIKRANLQS